MPVGELPTPALKLVVEWSALRRGELEAAWRTPHRYANPSRLTLLLGPVALPSCLA